MSEEKGIDLTAELPPVPITPVEGLSLLRDLVISLWIEWSSDPTDHVPLFMSCLGDLMKKPLLSFEGAVNQFNMQLDASDQTNEMHDLWRIFQMTLLSELGKDRESILDEFVLMVTRIMDESHNGDKLKFKLGQSIVGNVPPNNPVWMKSVRANIPQLVLLVVKVYISSVRVREGVK